MDSKCGSKNCQRTCLLISNNKFSNFCSVHNRKIKLFLKNLNNSKYVLKIINKSLNNHNKLVLLRNSKTYILGISLTKIKNKKKITKKNKEILLKLFTKLINNGNKKIILKNDKILVLGFYLRHVI